MSGIKAFTIKKIMSVLIILIIFIAVLAGCSSDTNSSGSASSFSVNSSSATSISNTSKPASQSFDAAFSQTEPVYGNIDLSEQGVVPNGNTLIWPVPNYTAISQPESHKTRWALDLLADMGASILAVAAGVVVDEGENTDDGLYIEIDHGDGATSRYTHNKENSVSVGDSVEAGQEIALVGISGYTSGPHLHFEYIVDGELVNPMDYLVEP